MRCIFLVYCFDVIHELSSVCGDWAFSASFVRECADVI